MSKYGWKNKTANLLTLGTRKLIKFERIKEKFPLTWLSNVWCFSPRSPMATTVSEMDFAIVALVYFSSDLTVSTSSYSPADTWGLVKLRSAARFVPSILFEIIPTWPMEWKRDVWRSHRETSLQQTLGIVLICCLLVSQQKLTTVFVHPTTPALRLSCPRNCGGLRSMYACVDAEEQIEACDSVGLATSLCALQGPRVR